MEYGKKIAHLRKSKNMTQEELGKVLSVTYQAVSKWERDESVPDFEMMSRIAKYFNVPLDYFTGDTEIKDNDDTPAQPVEQSIIGMCTSCGKMVTEEEIAQKEPKILCKSCAERQKKVIADKEKEAQEQKRRAKLREIYAQHGHGVDVSLFVGAIIAIIFYIVFTVYCGKASEDELEGAGIALFFVPLALFGAVQAFASFIRDLRDFDDDTEGYTRNISLIVAGCFAVVNFICFLTLYISIKDSFFIIMMVLSVILSFTFVSQLMWGGVVASIFTAGGFTFKLPGFIFTLTVESILWMIITKFLLGLLSIIVFVVTTVIVAVIAIFTSVVTFIPSLISKTVKDRAVMKN